MFILKKINNKVATKRMTHLCFINYTVSVSVILLCQLMDCDTYKICIFILNLSTLKRLEHTLKS